MSDDIVTRLREAAQVDEYYAVTVHRPMLLAIADEIERLQKLAHNLYEETKRCGSLHDTAATNKYEEWLEENE